MTDTEKNVSLSDQLRELAVRLESQTTTYDDSVLMEQLEQLQRRLGGVNQDRLAEKARADRLQEAVANALTGISKARDEHRTTASILGLPDPYAPAFGHPTPFEVARAELASAAKKSPGVVEVSKYRADYMQRVEEAARILSHMLPPGSYSAEGAVVEATRLVKELRPRVAGLEAKLAQAEREVDDVSLERDQALTRIGELDGELRRARRESEGERKGDEIDPFKALLREVPIRGIIDLIVGDNKREK